MKLFMYEKWGKDRPVWVKPPHKSGERPQYFKPLLFGIYIRIPTPIDWIEDKTEVRAHPNTMDIYG